MRISSANYSNPYLDRCAIEGGYERRRHRASPGLMYPLMHLQSRVAGHPRSPIISAALHELKPAPDSGGG